METELKDLKVGAEVYYTSGISYDSGTILKITRITHTMIICDNRRFKRSTGDIIRHNDLWNFPKIKILTDKLKDELLHNILSQKLNMLDFKRYDITKLKDILKILDRKEVD